MSRGSTKLNIAFLRSTISFEDHFDALATDDDGGDLALGARGRDADAFAEHAVFRGDRRGARDDRAFRHLKLHDIAATHEPCAAHALIGQNTAAAEIAQGDRALDRRAREQHALHFRADAHATDLERVAADRFAAAHVAREHD